MKLIPVDQYARNLAAQHGLDVETIKQMPDAWKLVDQYATLFRAEMKRRKAGLLKPEPCSNCRVITHPEELVTHE